MKFRLNIIFILFSIFSMASFAQSADGLSAHEAKHRQLLANQKNRIDKNVISDFINRDIIAAEQAQSNSLSLESAQMIDDLLDEGNKHLGKRYRRGSKGPKVFDCSGFTSYVYRQFGIELSSHSAAQYKNDGVEVDRKQLRKGDLVFFTSRNSGRGVGHVGIVTEADNDTGDFSFIHASVKGVKVSKCEGYYQTRYIGAKRIIQ